MPTVLITSTGLLYVQTSTFDEFFTTSETYSFFRKHAKQNVRMAMRYLFEYIFANFTVATRIYGGPFTEWTFSTNKNVILSCAINYDEKACYSRVFWCYRNEIEQNLVEGNYISLSFVDGQMAKIYRKDNRKMIMTSSVIFWYLTIQVKKYFVCNDNNFTA